MISILCMLGCLLLPTYLFSEEKKYGSLVYNSDIPNTLFLTGNIRNGDGLGQRSPCSIYDPFPTSRSTKTSKRVCKEEL